MEPSDSVARESIKHGGVGPTIRGIHTTIEKQ